MVYRKRLCELCGAIIPQEWDTDEHYGTCPSCKRVSNFVLKNEELRQIEKENKIHEERELEKIRIGALLDTYNVIKNTDTGRKIVHCSNLGKLILNECPFHFHTVEDKHTGKQEIFYYEDGIYHRGGENRIKELVNYYLDDLSTINRRNEVVDYIRHDNHTLRKNLEPPLNLG
jgi:phage FluMu protein Com